MLPLRHPRLLPGVLDVIESAVHAGARAGSARHILLVDVDDLGWTDLGCYGSSFHATPQLDAPGRGSCRLENAHAAWPVWAPSRGALMTGRVRARVGITQWIG